MEKRISFNKIIFIIGVIALIIGAIDPLEGSIIILFGSGLLALSTSLSKDKNKYCFLVLFIMIVFGFGFLFYFSSLGGFGGESTLSWWWGLLILPYPIGWLVTIILLIIRAMKNKKLKKTLS
jgi:hypothetical protein